MKILQILAGAEDGGLEKHVVELGNELAGAGEDVVLVADPRYRDRLRPEVCFQSLNLTRSRRNPIMLWQLLQRIRQHQPDLIHAQGGKAMAIVGTLKPWLCAPVIATIHNRKRRHGGLQALDAVITVSRELARELNHPRVHVIYNGIIASSIIAPEDARALRQQWLPTGEERLWLAVGRLVPAKGFDVLVEAFRRVPSDHLLIAGDGPEAYNLRSQIRARGLDHRITLLGHRSDVSALMTACDAVIIASRREGFSYVFAEALMQRRPVVSTNVPIPNEVLPPELICPTEDAASLAQRINDLDPDAHAHQQAQLFAQQHLTLPSMVTATRHFYREIIEPTKTDTPRTPAPDI